MVPSKARRRKMTPPLGDYQYGSNTFNLELFCQDDNLIRRS